MDGTDYGLDLAELGHRSGWGVQRSICSELPERSQNAARKTLRKGLNVIAVRVIDPDDKTMIRVGLIDWRLPDAR